MIKTKSCGCWGYRDCECSRGDSCECVSCYCHKKEAAENAEVLLKLAGIHARVEYLNNDRGDKFSCRLEPYEYVYNRRVYRGALKSMHYTSVDNLKKGIARILEKRRTDSSYLALNLLDETKGRFVRKHKKSTVFCYYTRPEFAANR